MPPRRRRTGLLHGEHRPARESGATAAQQSVGAIWITLALLVADSGNAGVIGGRPLFIFGTRYGRIILEFIMVLFRMNDSLQSIDRRGRGM